MEIELRKLSSPRIFLVRMLVFLVLCGLIPVVLYKQISTAFFANPGLNALIIAVLLIGTILSFRQVIRLYPEVSWVNNFRIADPGLAIERRPTLLAPMAAILGGERSGRMTISQQTMRHLLDSIATPVREYSGDGPMGSSGEPQGAVERLRLTLEEGGASRGTTAAMANLAEAIQGLVAHMRTEQQMIREWADGQGEQNREIKKLLEHLARQPEKS